MAANTRPYFIIYDGKHRMVEAANPASAVRHVVGAAVTELRPARGAEVAAWVRESRKIEVAGEKAAPAPPSLPGMEGAATDDAPQPKEGLGASSAALLLLAEVGPEHNALQIWADVVSMRRIELEQFDRLRVDAPKFVAAMSFNPSTPDRPFSVDEMRVILEDEPLPLDSILRRIGAAPSWQAAEAE